MAAVTNRTKSNDHHRSSLLVVLLIAFSADRTLAFRIPPPPSLLRHDHHGSSTLGCSQVLSSPPGLFRPTVSPRPLHRVQLDSRLRRDHLHASSCCRRRRSSPPPTRHWMTTRDDNDDDEPSKKKDKYFDPQTTVALIGGQSVLILLSIVLAVALQTPNVGLGPRFSLDSASVQSGCLLAIPLGALAAYLDTIEDQFPALQDVTKATQRSVLGLLGGTFKPIVGLLVSIALGIAAGVGEEMLFRGLLQYELLQRTGLGIVGSLGLSSVIFGLLHAVTPLYAFMATLASVYFGLLYVVFDNLAVPIACHSLYDIGALLYAHWTVAQLSDVEREQLAQWTGPASSSSRARDNR